MSDAPTPPPQPAIQAAAQLLAEGQPGQAAARLAALVDEAPTYAAAHVLYATALEAEGRPQQALDAWGRAAALVPRSPLVHRARVRLLAAGDAPAPERAAPPTPAPAEAEGPDLDREIVVDDPPPPAFDAGAEVLPPEPSAHDEDSDAPPADGGGWEVIAEEPVPTPPLDARAEPDVMPPDPDADAFAVADELDSLIAQLEDAPRIRPDPEFQGPEVAFDNADVDEMASETLAKIYAAQGQYAEAASIYDALARQQPERADEHRQSAAAMRDQA